MLKVRGGLYFSEKALRAYRRRDIRAKHLERDLAVVPHVVRELDDGHPSGAELALDRVSAAKRRGEMRRLGGCDWFGNRIGHLANARRAGPEHWTTEGGRR